MGHKASADSDKAVKSDRSKNRIHSQKKTFVKRRIKEISEMMIGEYRRSKEVMVQKRLTVYL